MTGGGFETIVVDDGSDGRHRGFRGEEFPLGALVRLEPCGLSAPATPEPRSRKARCWPSPTTIASRTGNGSPACGRVFRTGRFAAAGGPNLPPTPGTWEEAVVCAAPGAPSHVMLDDEEAEHLPGCNLAVTRAAFEPSAASIRSSTRRATMWISAGACATPASASASLPGPSSGTGGGRRSRAFLRQQLGYGRAEQLLLAKHPARFSKRGGAKWQGFIYGGGPVRVMADSIIYHGPMGAAGYQTITNRMLPLRGLEEISIPGNPGSRSTSVKFLQPRLRALGPEPHAWHQVEMARHRLPTPGPFEEYTVDSPEGYGRDHLIRTLIQHQWKPAGETDAWDLEKYGNRLLSPPSAARAPSSGHSSASGATASRSPCRAISSEQWAI